MADDQLNIERAGRNTRAAMNADQTLGDIVIQQELARMVNRIRHDGDAGRNVARAEALGALRVAQKHLGATPAVCAAAIDLIEAA